MFGRQDHLVEGVLRYSTGVAEALDAQEASVDVFTDVPKIVEIGQGFSNTEVAGIVEGEFRAQSLAFFEVLLKFGVFVIDVEAGIDAGSNDAGAEVAGSGASDFAAKDKLDLFRAAEVEIFADDFFKELAAIGRMFEDLGGADFELDKRERVAITGGTVFSSEGMRELASHLRK